MAAVSREVYMKAIQKLFSLIRQKESNDENPEPNHLGLIE